MYKMLHTRMQVSLKRMEILTCATTWMNPGDTILSAVSQSQKDGHCMSPLTCGSWSSQIHGDRKQNGGCQGLAGRQDGDVLFNGDSSSFGK